MRRETRPMHGNDRSPLQIEQTRPPGHLAARLRLTASLVVLTWSALGLVALRAYYVGRHERAYLVWNLFLAVIPFVFALGVDLVPSRKWSWVVAVPALGFWLAFFPNSPYLVTDLIHLEASTGVPLWFDALVFGVFAFTGLLVGFASLLLVHGRVTEIVGRAWGWAFAFTSLCLCGIGVYIGRFLRLNTWDIWYSPRFVVGQLSGRLLNPLSNPRMIVVSALFAGFMSVAYVALREFGAVAADSGTKRGRR
jgi:uncharacterized membrane protein